MKKFSDRYGRLIALLLILALVIALGQIAGKRSAPGGDISSPQIWRDIAGEAFPSGSDCAVVIDPDCDAGYCAGILAAQHHAPMLASGDAAALASEIERLGASTVYTVGDIAISTDAQVIVISASDAAIARACAAPQAVFIVSDGDIESAAALSGLSAMRGYPILMTSDAMDYIAETPSIATVYTAAKPDGALSDALAAMGRTVVSLYDADASVINGSADRMLAKGAQRIACVSDPLAAVCAAPLCVWREAVPIYAPERLSDTQQMYLAENAVSDALVYGGAEEIYRQAIRLCRGVHDRRFSFDESCSGAVFYSPHQDDETLYFSQMITAAADLYGSENVYVVLLSDGAASGAKDFDDIAAPINAIISSADVSVSESDAHRAAVNLFSRARTNEMIAALTDLGVTNIDVRYLHDSALPEETAQIKDIMLEYEHGGKGKLAHFAFSPYYDNHPDHRASGQALYELYRDRKAGEFENVRFIIKNEYEYDEQFMNAPGGIYELYTSYYTSQANAGKIRQAMAQYGRFSCDAEAVGADIAAVMQRDGCSMAQAVMRSEAVSSLRLGIGFKSVPSYFDSLDAHTMHRSTITTIHAPFDGSRYGGQEDGE